MTVVLCSLQLQASVSPTIRVEVACRGVQGGEKAAFSTVNDPWRKQSEIQTHLGGTSRPHPSRKTSCSPGGFFTSALKGVLEGLPLLGRGLRSSNLKPVSSIS